MIWGIDMGFLFGKKNKLDETERRRLWDGLAEFLRLNFRPDGESGKADSAPSAGTADAMLAQMAGAAMMATGARNDGAQAFMMNSAMPMAAQAAMASAAETPDAEAAEFDAEIEETSNEEPTDAFELMEDASAPQGQAAPIIEEPLGLQEKKPRSYALHKKSAARDSACGGAAATPKKRSLGDVVREVSETWQQSLLRKIDERGYSDAEVYKRAGLDRKLFSKIRCNEDYQPKKPTAVALALALRLSLDETRDMLARAGFALSPSSRFDLIVEYFIDNGIYDVDTINMALYEYGQQLLGA